MTQPRTIYRVADNTGAREVMHIRTIRGGKLTGAQVGDVIVGTVKRAIPHGTVAKKSVVKAVIVRTKNHYQRADGSSIRFDDNAVVLINNDNRPVGSRVFGPIAREIRDRGFREIVSLAPEVL